MGSTGTQAPKGTDGNRVWINDLEIEDEVYNLELDARDHYL